ncbi:hypothetical protein Nepgr_027106 [Nepenthes gracilis]|uniref:Scarecrow-like protein 15 n=1 Tax=Nepenthes gracilis TaxID=150966 RepID=A0AAD3T8D2_NEPGR|nr:hypothetical protein Nepgr_027106 [Nepenthes gracilis]
MKVPISSTQNNNSSINSKPLSGNNSSRNTAFHSKSNASSLCYEPTPVLALQSSPSPVTTTALPSSAPAAAVSDVLSVTNSPPSVDLDNLEGWDSILSELGLNDDSTPNHKTLSQFGPCSDPPQLIPQLPEFLPSQPFDHAPLIPPDFGFPRDFPSHQSFSPSDQPNVNNFGPDFIDDLVRAAQSFESGDSHHVHLILARLNQRLRSPVGKPLQRAAFYFKEALQSLLTGPNRPSRLSCYEIVQTIRAFKAFSGISPIPLFTTFTANQAILEAIDGSNFIHIVDFDIGFGCHWASLMREMVFKCDPSKANSIVLRITAVVPEEFGIESKLVRENLAQFARELNINFHIEYVLIRSFEILSFKWIKFIQGEKIAVHLSPMIFQRLGSRNNISKFLGDLRNIMPHVVVVIDREVGIDTGTSSFSLNFVAGLEIYTAMLESLDAATGGGFFGVGESARMIETFLLRPRILAAVEAAGRRGTPWRELFLGSGAKAVGPSQFSDFQADCLLRRLPIGGFHVAKHQGEMLLCWHERPLVATSAWRC